MDRRSGRPLLEALEARLNPSIAFWAPGASPLGTATQYVFSGTVGSAFSQTITTSGNNCTYSVVSGWQLPPGLTLNANSSGSDSFTVTGVPMQAGQFNVAFKATSTTNTQSTDTVIYEFLVSPPSGSLQFQVTNSSPIKFDANNLVLSPGITNQSYSATISLKGAFQTIQSIQVQTQNPSGMLVPVSASITPPGLTVTQPPNTKNTYQISGLTVQQIGNTVYIGGAPAVSVGGLNNPLFLTVSATPTTLAPTVSSSSGNTLTVSSGGTAGFPSSGTLLIGQEQLSYSGISGNTFENVQFGVNGTPAASPLAGTAVYLVQNFNLSITHSPQQIAAAYGLNDVVLAGGVKGTGAGQTVVIMDPYGDYAGFVSSTDPNFANSDLNQFDQAFGLTNFATSPANNPQKLPYFLKLGAYGGTDYPNSAPSDPTEVPQDIEWVHALAPQANIVVLEGNNSGGLETDTELQTIYNWVNGEAPANLPNNFPAPSVVSNSYGSIGSLKPPTSDSPDPSQPYATGVTYVMSSGDFVNGGKQGNGYVVEAGYSQITLNPNGTLASEQAVSGGTLQVNGRTFQSGGNNGSGETPSYQTDVASATGGTGRMVPDVGFNGSETSGDAVFNSFINTTGINFKVPEDSPQRPNIGFGGSPWGDAWGTSIAAPSWAALFAVANQGRALLNEKPLDGFTQTLPTLYSLAGTSAFNPIDSATNGTPIDPLYNASASVGSTGLGSPAANVLIPSLVGEGLQQVLYWDPQHLLSGTGSGGSGAWNTTSLNWFNGVTDVAWSNASNAIAVFEGSSGGTVTLGTAITASSLQFDTTGYTIQGNAVTLSSGAGSVVGGIETAGSTIGNIYVASGMSETLDSIVAGTKGINLSGGGTLNLNAANTYSGGTTVNDSTLGITNGANLGFTGIVSSITLYNSATLLASGNVSLSPQQNLLTVKATLSSSNTLTIGGAVNGVNTLTLGSGNILFKGKVGSTLSPDIQQEHGGTASFFASATFGAELAIFNGTVSFLANATFGTGGATFNGNVILGGFNSSFTSAGAVTFGSNSGSTLTINGSGRETVTTANNMNITLNAVTTASENLTFNVGTGTFQLNSGANLDDNGNLTIAAGKVNLNASVMAKGISIVIVP